LIARAFPFALYEALGAKSNAARGADPACRARRAVIA
jgi:hypothetical protein